MTIEIIVPLASPSYLKDKTPKGIRSYNSDFYLRSILKSRPWSKEIDINYNFVLIDSKAARMFTDKYLKSWFPESSCYFCMSALKGCGISSLLPMIHKLDAEWLIIDLADIEFRMDKFNIHALDQGIDAYAFVFESNSDKYSYFSVSNDNFIQYSAEKKVISKHASCGTYLFKDVSTYIKALVNILNNEELMYNGLYYITPIFNGLIAENKCAKIIKTLTCYDPQIV